MTAKGLAAFLDLPEQDRRDVFAATARRLDTVPEFVEKDFWVCLVLDVLFNSMPGNRPRILFKGGTSLSKGFGLIQRFSEDIDLVVHRGDLGFVEMRDPVAADSLSNKRRTALFKELVLACGTHVQGPMKSALATAVRAMTEGCRITPDDVGDGQTLLVVYPGLWPGGEIGYVQPRVKIEAGAQSARLRQTLRPRARRSSSPRSSAVRLISTDGRITRSSEAACLP